MNNSIDLQKIDCPVLGFVAFSGTGKTTLLKKLLPLLKQSGVRVGMIKHAHHDFDIDVPGKDSYELRKTGAEQMLVASSQRWALMVETRNQAGNQTGNQDDVQLQPLLEQLDSSKLDLILVEGFKHVEYPKIECHRPSQKHQLMCTEDNSIIAIAIDEINKQITSTAVPKLDLNNPAEIVEFIQKEILDIKTSE